jgi:hypothetical protein
MQFSDVGTKLQCAYVASVSSLLNVCPFQVWALNSNQLMFSFPGEHSRSTFFRSVGSTSGVTQVALDSSGHLFSCGADGSIKFRQLPEKEMMVHHFI